MIALLNVFGLCGLSIGGAGIWLLGAAAFAFGMPLGIIVASFGGLIMIGGIGGTFAIEQLVAIRALLQQQRS